jgi:CDP-glycerol glycerophosphotransferase (TagB/SpsB family)
MVLIRCGYGRFPMALAQSCRTLHIPSVEIQHGLITKYLPAYRRTKQTTNHDCIPEYLLADGEIFADLVQTGHLFDPHNITITGYPYLDKKLQEKTKDASIKPQFTTHTRNILITSQWIVAKEAQEFITQVAQQLEKSNLDVGILFKPHPFDKTRYDHWQHPSNIILVDKYEDIFKLFSFVDIHSTVYSTSGLEAMAFGIPNIFLDLFHLIPDNKSPYIVSSPTAFITTTKHIFDDYDTSIKEALDIASLFYAPSSEQRFKEFFRHHELEPNRKK